MKRLRNFRHLTVMLIGLALGVLLIGCGSSPLIQPKDVDPVTQPKMTLSPTASAALENETESVSQSPLPTPTFSGATNTPAPITSPTLVPPSPTSTTPDMHLTKTISGFQITEASVKIDTSGEAQFVLPITLNRAKLQPSVQEFVYLTTDPLDDQTSESTIWRTDVKDVSNPTPIFSMQHQAPAGPNSLTLSPNGKYLVYGMGYSDRTHAMNVVLLNIEDETQQVIDNGAVPRANSQALTWGADSQSVIYIKEFAETVSSELHQYSLSNEETQVLLGEEGLISVIGWHNSLIYYVPHTFSGSSYILKSFNIETGQIQEIETIEGSYVISDINTSPDERRVLFNSILVDLQTKTQTTLHFPPFFYKQRLWLPDSQGFLAAEPLSILRFTDTDHQVEEAEEKTELTFQAPVDIERSDWISWAPDGQYLIYRTKSSNHQSSYHLLNLLSGQAQQFTATPYFEIGGWISEE